MRPKIKKIIQSTILCIKYPFLYPRNRFSGRHYENHKINKMLVYLYERGYRLGTSENSFRSTIKNPFYSFLYKLLDLFYNYPLQWMFFIPTWTEWDAMESGWKRAFGDALLKDLKNAMIADGGYRYLYGVRIMQIKEKFGVLEIYLSSYGKKTQEVIERYNDLSWKTCIVCGKPATGHTTGWISPYCDDCADKIKHDNFVKFKNQ